MESATHQKLVLKQLKEAVGKDKARINIYPFSNLGLVELTRQRVKESIAREVFQSCPYCDGDGRVKSVETIGIEIKRKLQGYTGKEVTITAHPNVCEYLKDKIDKWRKALGIGIKLAEDKALHIEEYKLY